MKPKAQSTINRDTFTHRAILAVQEYRAESDMLRVALEAGRFLYGENGSVISGGFYADWPEPLKDSIRQQHRILNACADTAAECWRKAGRRTHTLRRLFDVR